MVSTFFYVAWEFTVKKHLASETMDRRKVPCHYIYKYPARGAHYAYAAAKQNVLTVSRKDVLLGWDAGFTTQPTHYFTEKKLGFVRAQPFTHSDSLSRPGFHPGYSLQSLFFYRGEHGGSGIHLSPPPPESCSQTI